MVARLALEGRNRNWRRAFHELTDDDLHSLPMPSFPV
jgi:hypothetical protein